ncbi:MAG: hypothetical protein JNJ61_23425 [Anaerolineae bacterium]|nr:hypothetical protein [Anaerolineae bacterium]
MSSLIYLIEQVSLGLYILIAVGMFWSWRRWTAAQRELRATHFELERDIFRYRRANAVTGFVVLVQLALVVFGIQQVVAPTIRRNESMAVTVVETITDLPFETPTPGPVEFGSSPIDASGVQLEGEELVRVLATPTLTPTPVGTILPNPPPVGGCDTPNATLQVPANGQLVFEPLMVIGTANTENFAFFRFEIKGPSTFESFAMLRQYDQPASEVRELGQFTPAFYEPGEYQFRLTVFDISNTLKAACTVNITISEPIPTPTPLPPP